MSKDEHLRILLAGSNESGKTTFLRQLRHFHNPDYLSQARASCTPIILWNLLYTIITLLELMDLSTPPIQCESEQTTQTKHLVQQASKNDDPMVPVGAALLVALWRDTGVQEAFGDFSGSLGTDSPFAPPSA